MTYGIPLSIWRRCHRKAPISEEEPLPAETESPPWANEARKKLRGAVAVKSNRRENF